MHDFRHAHHLGRATEQTLLRWVTVQLHRLQSDHAIVTRPEEFEALENGRAYALANELVEHLQSDGGIRIPEFEVLYLMPPLAGSRTPTSQMDAAALPVDDRDEHLVNNILDAIAFDMGVELKAKNFDLLGNFVRHIAFLLNRLRYRVSVGDSTIDAQTEYPVAYQMAKIARDVIARERNLTVTAQELEFVAAYFEVFLAEIRDRSRRDLRVGILATSGIAEAKLRQQTLTEALPRGIELSIVADETQLQRSASSVAASSAMQPEIDVLLAGNHDEVAAVDVPILRLSSNFDVDALRRKMKRMRQQVQWGLQAGDLDYLVAAMVTQRGFMTLESGSGSIIDDLNLMATTLRNRGVFDDTTAAALVERERHRTTIMNGRVAFPHVNTGTLDEPVLAVGIRTVPTVARKAPDAASPSGQAENDVSLVLMLALPEKLTQWEELTIALYDEIIRLANDPDLLGELRTCRTYDSFLRTLATAQRENA